MGAVALNGFFTDLSIGGFTADREGNRRSCGSGSRVLGGRGRVAWKDDRNALLVKRVHSSMSSFGWAPTCVGIRCNAKGGSLPGGMTLAESPMGDFHEASNGQSHVGTATDRCEVDWPSPTTGEPGNEPAIQMASL